MFNKILKALFSVGNEYNNNKCHKVLCILGFKMKFRNRKNELIFKLNNIENNIDTIIPIFNARISELNNKLNEIKSEQNKKNIYKEVCKLATVSTAQYILENMNKIEKFPNQNTTLMDYALKQVSIEGLYLEFGVYSGNSINHISQLIGQNIIYGFDSFEGLPEDWRTDFQKGTFVMEKLPKVNNNVELIKGWFEDTIIDFKNNHTENCAFIHVDCDLYSSAATVFKLLEDRIKSGTVILFDEYSNYPGWEDGEYKAFQEFIERTKLKYKYIGYNEAHEQCAVIIQ